MIENKIASTLEYIDQRIENYSLPLFTAIVKAHTNDLAIIQEASRTLRTALRTANLFDFYYETVDKDFLSEAHRQMGTLFQTINPADQIKLKNIGNKIIPFFEFEKLLWKKVLSGEKATDEEIREFLKQRSSDALFYAGVVKIFVPEPDFSTPLHVNMQILDLKTDIKEWDKDIEDGSPNILFMFLSRNINPERLKQLSKNEAIELAKEYRIDKQIIQMAKTIRNEVSDFDFAGYEFIADTIAERAKDLSEELGIKAE